MTLEVAYEIQFTNDIKIAGRINCKIGQEILNIKKKILQFQGVKNQGSFKLVNSETLKDSRVTKLTKIIKFKQQKVLKQIGSVVSIRSRKMTEDSMFEQSSIIFEDDPNQNFIEEEPQIPPTVCGYVTFPNSFFFCFSSSKYLILTSQSIKFYNDENSQILFKQIKIDSVHEIKSYKRKYYYCIRIVNDQDQINMKFINKDICKEWVGYFNQVINFTHFLKQKKAFSQKQSFQKYIDTLFTSNTNLGSTNIVKLQDDQQTVIQSVHRDIPCEGSIKKFSRQILKLSSFQITHKVDSGSFSTIYLANTKGKQMVLKQMNKQKLLYKNQMKYAITQLNVLIKGKKCPYIIPIYYAFQTYQYLYLALKYIPYGNLGRLIQKKGKLPESQAIMLIAQLIVAIQYLHHQKILYRDLKPENILIDNNGHLYLTDFGLAKQLDQKEQAHSFLGTPLYLAPQRFLGNGTGIDYRSDIYAVGIIFFEMLHGYHPFSADNYNSVVYNIKNTEIQFSQDISSLARKFLMETLQKKASKRLQKMSSHPLFKTLDWKKILLKQHQGIKLVKQSSRSVVQINYPIDQDYNQSNYPNNKIIGWNFNFEDQNQISK